MQWLSDLVKYLVQNVFGLDLSSRLGGSIHFYIYDVIKIFILLSVLISESLMCRVIFAERTKKMLGRVNAFGQILWAHCSYCYAFLLLLFYSVIYRLYQCGASDRRHVFFSDIIAFVDWLRYCCLRVYLTGKLP
jgi:hypothetical protein